MRMKGAFAFAVAFCFCQGTVFSQDFSISSNRQENNVFVPGEEVFFDVKGEAKEGQNLTYSFHDFWDKEVSKGEKKLVPGEFKESIKFQSPLAGYFELRAETRAGDKTIKTTTMPFAVIPEPTKEMREEGFKPYVFGFCGAGIAKEALTGPLADFYKFVGSRWRFDGNNSTWFDAEPAKGKWKLPKPREKDYERVMRYIAGTPEWARKSPGSLYPCDWSLVEPYVRTVTQRLKTEKLPRVYLLGNEHCAVKARKDSFQDEISYCRIAAETIRKEDPEATILMYIETADGGNVYSDWNTQVLDSGILKFCDGLQTHYYISGETSPEAQEYGRAIDELRAMLEKRGYKDKIVWPVEQGYATAKGSKLTEIQKAEYIVRRTVMALSRNIPCFIEHSPADFPTNQFYGLVHHQDYYLGKEKDVTYYAPKKILPKPSFPAYCVMTRQLIGAKFADKIDYLGETSLAYVFEKDGMPVIVAWDYGEKNNAVSLEVGSESVRIVDLMGNERTVKTPGGRLSLTLSKSPVYIHGGDPKNFLVSENQKTIRAENATLKVFPGEKVTAVFSLSNPSDKTLDGELVVETTDAASPEFRTKAVRLQPKEQTRIFLPLSVSNEAALRLHPVKARLDADGRVLGRALARVSVERPLEIQKVLPGLDGTGRTVKATLRNFTDNPAKGTMSVKLGKETLKEAGFEIPANYSKDISVTLPEKEMMKTPALLPFDIAVEDATGRKESVRAWLSFVECKKVSGPIKIDGGLDEFRDIPPIKLEDASLVQPRENWNGGDDLSGGVRLAWDDKYLYLTVEVNDDKFLQESTGVGTWAYDCLQVAVDPLPGEKQEYDQISMSYKKKNSEYILALTKDGPRVHRSVSWDKTNPEGDMKSDDILLAVRKTDKGLIYEAAFPWADLSVERPSPGIVLGFAMTINDRDEKGGRFKALEWFNGILHGKDPSKFGQIILKE